MKFRQVYWMILTLFTTIQVLGQKHRITFEHLSSIEGLSQSNVLCILQDSRGFMWFGTQDGLNKYDGYEVKIFRRDPSNRNSLSNDYIKAISEDKYGNLWIATWGNGINKFDRKTERFSHFENNPKDPKSIPSNFISNIITDHEGILWLSSEYGLISLDPSSDKFTHYLHDPKNPNSLSTNFTSSV